MRRARDRSFNDVRHPRATLRAATANASGKYKMSRRAYYDPDDPLSLTLTESDAEPAWGSEEPETEETVIDREIREL